MKTAWTAGVKEGDKKNDIVSAFKSSPVLRKRLTEMCKKKSESSYRLSPDEYDCVNWTLKQADSVGYRRALEEIISLLE
jgi:hypothetical protein